MMEKEKAKELASVLVGEDQNPEPLVEILMEMAQWKEQQMMKDAIDGKVCWYDDEVFLDTDDSMFLYLYTHKGFKVGDKVKVIIIKED